LSSYGQDVVEKFDDGEFVRCVSERDTMGLPINEVCGSWLPVVEYCDVAEERRATACLYDRSFDVAGDCALTQM